MNPHSLQLLQIFIFIKYGFDESGTVHSPICTHTLRPMADLTHRGQLRIQYQAQGHFGMWHEEPGIKPPFLWLVDDCSTFWSTALPNWMYWWIQFCLPFRCHANSSSRVCQSFSTIAQKCTVQVNTFSLSRNQPGPGHVYLWWFLIGLSLSLIPEAN